MVLLAYLSRSRNIDEVCIWVSFSSDSCTSNKNVSNLDISKWEVFKNLVVNIWESEDGWIVNGTFKGFGTNFIIFIKIFQSKDLLLDANIKI